MGELLRRYWLPVAATSELQPGQRQPVRLLGEDLALFRTTDGTLGLLDARCPHRGASLAYGIVDDCSIRCAYHGWRFDRTGACLELPSLCAATSPLRERARIRAHLAEELGGLVFAYLGPEPAPLLPRYDLFVWPGALRDIGRRSSRATGCRSWRTASTRCTSSGSTGTTSPRCGGPRACPRRRATAPPRGDRLRRLPARHRQAARARRAAAATTTTGESATRWCFPSWCASARTASIASRSASPSTTRTRCTSGTPATCRARGRRGPPQEPRSPSTTCRSRTSGEQFLLDFVDGGDIMTWVSQGPIADRTREMLVDTDRGIAAAAPALLRADRARRERARIRSASCALAQDNVLIELPQERDKYGAGDAFLAESMAMSHVALQPDPRPRSSTSARPPAGT